MGRWLRFNTILWLAVGAAVLYLMVWPLVMNAWATWRWKAVPAYVTEGRYVYRMDRKYVSTRRDFWQLGAQRSLGIQDQTDPEPNGTCWVSPGDPENSVLVLDAHRNWANAGPRAVAAVMLACVAAGLTWMGRKSPGRSAP